jgi:hypothetical protein
MSFIRDENINGLAGLADVKPARLLPGDSRRLSPAPSFGPPLIGLGPVSVIRSLRQSSPAGRGALARAFDATWFYVQTSKTIIVDEWLRSIERGNSSR